MTNLNAPAGSKRGKKCKAPDRRPARSRYWLSGRPAARKIRNLVRSGYSPKAAIAYWESARKRNKGTHNLVTLLRNS